MTYREHPRDSEWDAADPEDGMHGDGCPCLVCTESFEPDQQPYEPSQADLERMRMYFIQRDRAS
jgi:hypothetical protein